MDIFISYAKEDSENASRLYRELAAIPGVTPWLDSEKLLPGVRWKLEIMQALRTCDLFVVLLSKNAVSKSGFVQHEIGEALDRLKSFPPDRIFVIPARLDECCPAHPELRELQWVDLFPDWDSGFAQIAKVIGKLTGGAVAVPSVPSDIVMETITTVDSFHRRLQVRGEMRGCDAMELQFHGEQFHGLDFAGANFVRCRFGDCDFRECSLRGVNFEGVVFEDCRFTDADLWGVNFWGANISGICDLDRASLQHTNFYLTQYLTREQETVVDSPNSIHLEDYVTFLRYFADEVGMGEEAIARTFVWVNHQYFRLMFDKISSQVFRRRIF